MKETVARLVALAEARVGEVAARLPEELRRLAAGLPVYYEWEMDPCWLGEGLEPDLLGLFSGPSLLEQGTDTDYEGPRITLFLANLWDYAEEDRQAFLEEVRITYMHEFGHYLGWEEEDLEERGLL